METRKPVLVGVIERKDGFISLRTRPGVWWPLGGSSSLAECFRDTFGDAQEIDVGKRVYECGGILQMENDAQRLARLLKVQHAAEMLWRVMETPRSQTATAAWSELRDALDGK